MKKIFPAQVYEGLEFIETGALTVHSSFRHAVNLKSDSRGGLFSLVSFDKPLVPNGAVVGCTEMPFAEAGSRVEYHGGKLEFPDFSIDFSSAVSADLKVGKWIESRAAAARVVEQIESAVRGRTPGIQKLAELKELDSPISEVVAGLVGLGPGLTPSGDDFICGWLWAWRSCGDPRFSELAAEVEKRRCDTTDASSNFMMLACGSRFAAALKVARNHPEEGFKWMAAQGASSGVDTLFGARFGIQNADQLK